MRALVLTLGCALLAASAEAQVPRAAPAPGDEPITVAARVRHVTAIVLPETAEIVEVVVGDAEQWDVSAAAHLAFVRPLAEGARSNAVLLTGAGRIVPLALVESAESAVDAVVRVGAAAAREEENAPVLAAAGAVETAAAASRHCTNIRIFAPSGHGRRIATANLRSYHQRFTRISPMVAVLLLLRSARSRNLPGCRAHPSARPRELGY